MLLEEEPPAQSDLAACPWASPLTSPGPCCLISQGDASQGGTPKNYSCVALQFSDLNEQPPLEPNTQRPEPEMQGSRAFGCLRGLAQRGTLLNAEHPDDGCQSWLR